jgi:hypothetical protein
VEEAGEAIQRRGDEAMQRHRAQSAAASDRSRAPTAEAVAAEASDQPFEGGEEVSAVGGARGGGARGQRLWCDRVGLREALTTEEEHAVIGAGGEEVSAVGGAGVEEAAVGVGVRRRRGHDCDTRSREPSVVVRRRMRMR